MRADDTQATRRNARRATGRDARATERASIAAPLTGCGSTQHAKRLAAWRPGDAAERRRRDRAGPGADVGVCVPARCGRASPGADAGAAVPDGAGRQAGMCPYAMGCPTHDLPRARSPTQHVANARPTRQYSTRRATRDAPHAPYTRQYATHNAPHTARCARQPAAGRSSPWSAHENFHPAGRFPLHLARRRAIRCAAICPGPT